MQDVIDEFKHTSCRDITDFIEGVTQTRRGVAQLLAFAFSENGPFLQDIDADVSKRRSPSDTVGLRSRDTGRPSHPRARTSET